MVVLVTFENGVGVVIVRVFMLTGSHYSQAYTSAVEAGIIV
jgi:hypothetical protein